MTKIFEINHGSHKRRDELMRYFNHIFAGQAINIPFCVRTGAPDCRVPPTTKGLATVDIFQQFLSLLHNITTGRRSKFFDCRQNSR